MALGFHVQVKSVSPLRLMEDKIVWKVVVENVKTKKEATYDFDAIIVCNGHYSVPHIPDIPGVETFNGTKLHSHSYREPERFTGLNVVLLGASSSGVDISLELARHARQSSKIQYYNVPFLFGCPVDNPYYNTTGPP
uniref:Flavin-containing monooxygenase n=1 Tax=Timema poppense TaxID=170557 RepID=A0A7R9DNP3_TIMPO|nr:unnamed protein product [Timema poppensis]